MRLRQGHADLVLQGGEEGRDPARAFRHAGLDVVAQQGRQHGRGAAGADGGDHLAPVDDGGVVKSQSAGRSTTLTGTWAARAAPAAASAKASSSVAMKTRAAPA